MRLVLQITILMVVQHNLYVFINQTTVKINIQVLLLMLLKNQWITTDITHLKYLPKQQKQLWIRQKVLLVY